MGEQTDAPPGQTPCVSCELQIDSDVGSASTGRLERDVHIAYAPTSTISSNVFDHGFQVNVDHIHLLVTLAVTEKTSESKRESKYVC